LTDLERAYSGYLVPRRLSESEVQQVIGLGKEYGLDLDVSPTAIDFEFTGRDTNRFVVQLLVRLARLISDAEGEVRCQVSGDANELWFEFYRVRGGKLLRQLGKVVRGSEEPVAGGGG
jgi:hypothetical protein